jgi:hypothetical protein
MGDNGRRNLRENSDYASAQAIVTGYMPFVLDTRREISEATVAVPRACQERLRKHGGDSRFYDVIGRVDMIVQALESRVNGNFSKV